MSDFSISTRFTREDLTMIYAAQSNVIVAKPSPGSDPDDPRIAWIVYRPLNNNKVQWEEKYGIYASNVDLLNGAVLGQMSQTPYPAVAGKLYTMQPDGNIDGPAKGGIGENSYAIVNKYNNVPTPATGSAKKGYLTMGLYQPATVDGVAQKDNAVSAAVVMHQNTAIIEPSTTVWVWLQSQVRSNTVVTTTTSPTTVVTLTATSANAILEYDAASGTFVPVADPADRSGAQANISLSAVEHIFPRL